ncbi:MAG: hypothetical protein U0271_23210 [Polyangiaceae bacterium]
MKRVGAVLMVVGCVAFGCSDDTSNTGGSGGSGGAGGDPATSGGGSGGAGGSDLLAEAAANVVGDWVDENPCEALPTGPDSTAYLGLAFSFDGTRWTSLISAYADPQCSVGLFDAEIGGTYTFEEASTAVVGAIDTQFSIDTITVTALNDQMAGAFSQQMCGGNANWTVGAAGDVSDTGCLFIPSVSACPAEYDLVQVDTTELRFGQRPAMGDICDPARRPGALSTSTFVRAN